MSRDRMQKQRFELKYLISEETALLVRDFVRSYLDFDEYSVGKPNYSYPVHSLYVDSHALALYWATINLDTPDPQCDLDYVPHTARPMRINAVVNNSFGFGGHNASVVAKKFEG